MRILNFIHPWFFEFNINNTIFSTWLDWLLTLTEYANDNVTARGRPSGTATTNTVTPIIKNLTKNCE